MDDFDDIDSPASMEDLGGVGKSSKAKVSDKGSKSVDDLLNDVEDEVKGAKKFKASKAAPTQKKEVFNQPDLDDEDQDGEDDDNLYDEESSDDDLYDDDDSDDQQDDEDVVEEKPVVGKTKSKSIPIDRFKEVNDKRKSAEDDNIRLRAQLDMLLNPAQKKEEVKQQPAYDFKAKLKESSSYLFEGEMDKHLELQAEIEEERLKLAEKKATEKIEAALALREKQQMETVLNRTVADVLEKYPFLDDSSDEADQDAIDFLIGRREKLMSQGVPIHTAIERAAEQCAKIFSKEEFVEEKPKKGTQSDRARKSLEKAVDAGNRQAPHPSAAGVGNRAQKQDVDYTKLSPAGLAKLNQKQRDDILRNT